MLNGLAGFGTCFKILKNFLASRDDLLKCSDLHQLPAANRTARSLQGDDQVSPLLSELDQREPVINQLVHVEKPLSQYRHKIKKLCLLGFRDIEHFRQLSRGTRRRGKGRRASRRRPSLATAGSGAAVRFRCTPVTRACYAMVNDRLTKSGGPEAFPGQEAARLSYVMVGSADVTRGLR